MKIELALIVMISFDALTATATGDGEKGCHQDIGR